MRRFYTLLVCSLLFSGYIAAHFSSLMSLAAIQQVTSSLQNVALGLFTLAGIWIAYTYPEAINAYTHPKKVSRLKANDGTDRVESLIFVILCSAVTLASVLIFNVIVAVFNNHPTIIENRAVFKGAGVFFLLNICILQIVGVWQIFINNFYFLRRLIKLRTDIELDKDL